MDYVSIPFPQDLYNRIILRSGGKLDPVSLAVDQVEQFIERTRDEPLVWTREGVAQFAAEQAVAGAEFGDPDRGHQWSFVFLPNGTELRMKYLGKTHYATIKSENVVSDATTFSSVSQWVRNVARGTSRNAWHDVWIRFPKESEFRYSDTVRDAKRKELVRKL
ncbi:hypothetical protein NKJ73_07070 [Mesorhizobium sp. M0074]|uniref:hypothetical protein n=1 Tax=unclassified Mesorhizobium TaxID=325217 RepID=UPI0033373043